MNSFFASAILGVVSVSLVYVGYVNGQSYVNYICKGNFPVVGVLSCGNVTGKQIIPAADVELEITTYSDKANIHTIVIGNSVERNLLADARIPFLIRLSAVTFKDYKSLTTVVIDYAKEVTIEASTLPFNELVDNLHTLNMTNIQSSIADVLLTLENNLKPFTALKQLHLVNNSLNDADGFSIKLFSNTPNLQQLSFANSRIDKINSDYIPEKVRLPSLTYLDLGYNPSPMDVLIATNKVFGNFDAPFLALFPALQTLIAPRVGLALDKLPNLLNALPASLFNLNLAANKFSGIDPDVFKRFSSLNSLNLNYIPNLFKGSNLTMPLLPNLDSLYVCLTNTVELPVTLLDSLPKLTILDARDNAIKTFPNDLAKQFMIFNKTYPAKKILLQKSGGSQLVCDCSNSYLMHWLSNDTNHRPRGDAVLCYPRPGFRQCPTCTFPDSTESIGLDAAQADPRMNVLRPNCPAMYPHNESGGHRLEYAWQFTALIVSLSSIQSAIVCKANR